MNAEDIEALFIEYRSKLRFSSLTEEVLSIKQGIKKMSFWEFDREYGDDDNEVYEEITAAAYGAGLAVVHIPVVHETTGFRLERFRVFVLEHHEMWRIIAFELLAEAACRRGWADSTEALQSMLLGYRDEDVEDWMSVVRSSQVVWGMSTVYMVLTPVVFKDVVQSGMRLLPVSELEGCLIVRTGGRAPARDSHVEVGDRFLCRAALRHADSSAIFDMPAPTRGECQVRTLDEITSVRVNRVLKSNLEVKAAAGWLNDWIP